mmetsp:Transcript_878/g.948  ORF Transcript_878/g.948 Transcript_878/m.948 type:complete len:253 (+) Transcript_878:148-906(+)
MGRTSVKESQADGQQRSRSKDPSARGNVKVVQVHNGVIVDVMNVDSGKSRVDVSALNRSSGFWNGLQSLFIPDGYPGSVRDGYLSFQFFDSMQGLCSYLRGVLSTQAILEGLGVGTGTASALSATTQWVYRDGAGMLGGLFFAWAKSGSFDCNVKRWRLFADISVDIALTLELASPLICGEDKTCFTASVCTACAQGFLWGCGRSHKGSDYAAFCKKCKYRRRSSKRRVTGNRSEFVGDGAWVKVGRVCGNT